MQEGRAPRDWKSMPSLGAGVIEIRVRAGGAFRLVFVPKFEECIYVLHVFEKRSRKTSKLDLALIRSRYRLMLRTRSPG